MTDRDEVREYLKGIWKASCLEGEPVITRATELAAAECYNAWLDLTAKEFSLLSMMRKHASTWEGR